LPGLPGSNQDIHKVGQEIERAEVIVEPALNLMSSRTRACATEGSYDICRGARGAMLDPTDDSGSTIRRKVPVSPAFTVRVRDDKSVRVLDEC
jgi:hypothetical protein